MMTNLFSIFNPTSTSFQMNMNWVSMFIILTILMKNFWSKESRITKMIYYMKNKINLDYKKMSKAKIPMIMLMSLMFFILINNTFGLLPYIFTSTTHLVVTMFMSMIMWISINMIMWTKNLKKTMSHMIPENTPMVLSPFMVIIELISSVIRPITLSVRLTANMMAGHMIINLISSMCEKMTDMKMIIMTMMVQSMIMLLEIMVALIQAYVFTTLTLLYINETN
uniref:ATP synthase F0 subunit 6 n=1 Tax=Pentapycnon charcoti TaxID=373304 RepID=UPI00226C7D40|nr:ATP synthase F0 subunit 6 [Pentapycnon charcoti]UZA61213.1 ATP synthase F0 subunit 6 [Pentapycnon charcoti]